MRAETRPFGRRYIAARTFQVSGLHLWQITNAYWCSKVVAETPRTMSFGDGSLEQERPPTASVHTAASIELVGAGRQALQERCKNRAVALRGSNPAVCWLGCADDTCAPDAGQAKHPAAPQCLPPAPAGVALQQQGVLDRCAEVPFAHSLVVQLLHCLLSRG